MSLLISKTHDHIAEISINRPELRNALNKELLLNLSTHLDLIENNADIRVVIVSGTGDKAFSAGADLKERAGMSEGQAFEFVTLIQATFQKIAMLKVPTIAALNGDAFGGGLELALACDMRIGSSALQLGLTECALGIIPGAGGTQRLPMIVGMAKAMELIFGAKRIYGDEAYQIGLLNELCEKGEALNVARVMAQKIAHNAPLALKAAKKALLALYQPSLVQGLATELNCYREILGSKDRIEGLNAFKEKRTPHYSGL